MNWILVEDDTPDYPIPVWVTRSNRQSVDWAVFDKETNQWYGIGKTIHVPWEPIDDVVAWATNMPPLPYGFNRG